MVMKFFCAVMLIGILVSCSHGRAFPTEMLAKVNFNKIADEMDIYEKRREEKRDETRQDTIRECGPCGVCCVACVHKYMIFTFFFACGGGAVDLPQRVIFFCFSLQFQALFHMLTLLNM